MKKNYVKISADGNLLGEALIGCAARSIAMLVERLKDGGTLTVRGNAYEIEAIWNPPINRKPDMPTIAETQRPVIGTT